MCNVCNFKVGASLQRKPFLPSASSTTPNSSWLFTNPLTAGFPTSLPKQKHWRAKSRQLRRLVHSSTVVFYLHGALQDKYGSLSILNQLRFPFLWLNYGATKKPLTNMASPSLNSSLHCKSFHSCWIPAKMSGSVQAVQGNHFLLWELKVWQIDVFCNVLISNRFGDDP